MGEKAIITPDIKPKIFLNGARKFFPWSNLSAIWKEKEAKSLLIFHKRTGIWIKKIIIIEINMMGNEGPFICFLWYEIKTKTPTPSKTALYFVSNAKEKKSVAKYQ